MIEVIHADALDLDASDLHGFDVLIVDPPYSEHVHANAVSTGTAGAGPRDRDFGFTHLSPELRAQIALAAASVRRWSIVFSDHESTHEWRAAMHDAGAEYVRMVPWIRWSQPQLSGDRPCTGSEAVLAFHAMSIGARGGRKPLRKHWNGPGSLTHFDRRCMRGVEKHPAEKPLDLMLDLVSYFSDPGDTVLDLCGGAGTTALACRLLGRSCVLVEADARWATIARGRVSGPLSGRDEARALEWCEAVHAEALTVPTPSASDGSDVRTWERAQRRLADVATVAGVL